MSAKYSFMKNFWTSIQPINGLRHFVLVNKIKKKNQIIFLMVSVIDIDVSLEISKEELLNSEKWIQGWLNLPISESITKGYLEYKNNKNFKDVINKILVNKNSIFNIS